MAGVPYCYIFFRARTAWEGARPPACVDGVLRERAHDGVARESAVEVESVPRRAGLSERTRADGSPALSLIHISEPTRH